MNNKYTKAEATKDLKGMFESFKGSKVNVDSRFVDCEQYIYGMMEQAGEDVSMFNLSKQKGYKMSYGKDGHCVIDFGTVSGDPSIDNPNRQYDYMKMSISYPGYKSREEILITKENHGNIMHIVKTTQDFNDFGDMTKSVIFSDDFIRGGDNIKSAAQEYHSWKKFLETAEPEVTFIGRYNCDNGVVNRYVGSSGEGWHDQYKVNDNKEYVSAEKFIGTKEDESYVQLINRANCHLAFKDINGFIDTPDSIKDATPFAPAQ